MPEDTNSIFGNQHKNKTRLIVNSMSDLSDSKKTKPSKNKLTNESVEKKFTVVLPGQAVPIPTDTTKIRVGRGLLADQSSLVATRCGILRDLKGRLDVQGNERCYLPEPEDIVLGTVIEKHTESYRLEIGTTHPARLNALAFEGASKRNRPNIAVGGLVYCRVEVANKDIETELTCISPYMKKDWVTGESLYGELKDGYAFQCSINLARSLFAGTAPVLNELEKHGVPFEIAAGVNGRVWVKAETALQTVVIANAILNSDGMPSGAMKHMVARLVSVSRGRAET
jgi:exosome complex component RRP40